MSKRITITLNDRTERELQEIMEEYGFATQSQAATYAIATWKSESESAEFWRSQYEKMLSNQLEEFQARLKVDRI